jgi:uncharacterized membrane protein YccC
MSTSFVTNATLAVAAGFLVVASQAFSPSTTAWIAFGIAIGILALASLAQADTSRGAVQRMLDGIVAIVAAWTIVASVVFDGTTLKWLTLGEAVALFALAAAGLAYNESREQKAVRAADGTGLSDSLRAAA